jgi:hypothetical protein
MDLTCLETQVERKYGGFVSVNLDSSLPSLYQNLYGLEVVNAPKRLKVEMDVERLNSYFLTIPLLNGAGDSAVSRTQNVPEYSCATVSESEIYDAVMSIRSDADGADTLSLLLIKLLLPLVLLVLIHIFNHIFVSSEFPEKRKTSVVLPIPKIGSTAKFSDYSPISILVCLSKVFEVLMARQMERHICSNDLQIVFQSVLLSVLLSVSILLNKRHT